MKNPPGNTFQCLPDCKNGEGVRLYGIRSGYKLNNGAQDIHKEGYENCSVHKNQAQDGGPSVPQTGGDGSC